MGLLGSRDWFRPVQLRRSCRDNCLRISPFARSVPGLKTQARFKLSDSVTDDMQMRASFVDSLPEFVCKCRKRLPYVRPGHAGAW